MASSSDFWFVRLPDGRTLRSRSTESLRSHIKAGRIPWESRLRRASDEPWQTLDRVPEVADLEPSDSEGPAEDNANEPAPRIDRRAGAAELRTLGVRGLVAELFNAFDSSLQKAKLTTAAITGILIGVTFILCDIAILLLPAPWTWSAYLGTGLILCILFSVCTSILTQMTALELSRFRPAHFGEIRAGLIGSSLRLTCAFALVGGIIGGSIVLLHLLPGWITPADPRDLAGGIDMLLNVLRGVRLLLEVICWPILGFAMLLLGPILIVEDYSIGQALAEWLAMLRQHLGRIYLYQALAFAFAAVLTLPLLVPVALAVGAAGGNPLGLSLVEAVPFFLLLGVALTPMLSYLLVAHVFIYLNLRYEFFFSTRER